MTSITPFRIDIPQSQLVDLHHRLDLTRWPDEMPGVGWDFGIPLGYVKELVAYWRHFYDWRAQERLLNSFPQFTTEIDGQNVHFLHIRSANPDALPLIITHGWPGSFVEFLKIIEPLGEDFHLVIPSLPGFTFSGPTRERGWTSHRIARAWAELMHRLGYERYGAHGSDWGSSISRELGRIDSKRVIGVHLVNIYAIPPGNAVLTDDEKEMLQRQRASMALWGGYRAIQSTRPQTIAYGLVDSPVGQLAWIVEKFKEWTDCAEAPEEAVDRDQMLTNVMLYWLTGTAGSAARLYREGPSPEGPSQPSTAPTQVAIFPRDVGFRAPRRYAETLNEITCWSEFDRGGHFPAMEEPDLLSADIGGFFKRLT